MTVLRRTTCMCALLAGFVVSCDKGGSPVARVEDAGAKVAGPMGGSGSGGSSAKGGAAGEASGGSTGAGGVGGTGAGGSAGNGGAGGSGGQSTGSGGMTGGAGTSASGTGGGTGGSGGGSSGTSKDAGADAPTDGPVRSDGRGSDSACPMGQALCGGSCIDVMGSTSNCGGCGNACAADQVCSTGSCVGTTANDGCSDTLASNLSLDQVAIYQTVKIPIMKTGSEVVAASRNSAVVNGRPTVVRVFVTPGSNWTARDLSARLTVVPPTGQQAVYTSKKTISAASTDADTKSTFQFSLPAEAVVTGLAYSVEVVECGSASGSDGKARFPASGTIDMGIKATGPLKVKLIPLSYNNLTPDTSSTALAPYAAELKAMYPITDISFTVGDTLTITSVSDWSAMLDQVRAKRTADKPAADIYYFGLIKPADTLRAYCQSTCTTGIGYVVSSATSATASNSRAAMGIGFGDKASTETMAHELGHNHGRNHAPCSTAGTISGVDPNYPKEYASAIIGAWGYDARTQSLLDPTKYKDIMSYCSNQWISDYNYSALVTRVAAVNGAAKVVMVSADMARWRVLLVDGDRGPRWGIPFDEPASAEGEPETAVVYDDSGAELTTVRVYRTDIGDLSGRMYMVPEPKTNWYAIAVSGAVPLPFAAPMPAL